MWSNIKHSCTYTTSSLWVYNPWDFFVHSWLKIIFLYLVVRHVFIRQFGWRTGCNSRISGMKDDSRVSSVRRSRKNRFRFFSLNLPILLLDFEHDDDADNDWKLQKTGSCVLFWMSVCCTVSARKTWPDINLRRHYYCRRRVSFIILPNNAAAATRTSLLPFVKSLCVCRLMDQNGWQC